MVSCRSFFISVMAAISLLESACSRIPLAASRLTAEPREVKANELNEPEWAILGALERSPSDTLVVKFGTIFHEVKGCSSVDVLASLLEANLPPDHAFIKEQTLLDAGYKKGRTLSCDGSIPATAQNTIFHQEKNRWRFASGQPDRNYVLREKASGCSSNQGFLTLFGVRDPELWPQESFEIDAVQDQALKCQPRGMELLGATPVDPATNAQTYFLRIDQRYHRVTQCRSAFDLAQRLGMAVPAGLRQDRNEDYFKEQLKLTQAQDLSCAADPAKTYQIHIDDNTGLFYISAGVEGLMFYLDSRRTLCPGEDISSLLAVFGIVLGADNVDLIYARPALAQNTLRMDCKKEKDGLGRRTIDIYPTPMGDPASTDPTKKVRVNFIVFTHIEDGVRYDLPILAHKGQLLTSTKTLPFDECRAIPEKNDAADSIVQDLSSRYLSGEFESFSELPTLNSRCAAGVMFSFLGGTPYFDYCTGNCQSFKPQHYLSQLVRADGFLKPLASSDAPETPVRLETLTSERGDFDYSYQALAATNPTEGSPHKALNINYVGCDRTFLQSLGFMPESPKSQDDWLKRWGDYYRLNGLNPAPTGDQLQFSCRDLSKSECVWNVGGTHEVAAFNSMLSAQINACPAKRLTVKLTADLTLRGSSSLALSGSSRLEEVVFTADAPRKFIYEYICTTNACSAPRDLQAMTGLINPISQGLRKAVEFNQIQFSFRNPAGLPVNFSLLNVNNNEIRLIDSSIQGSGEATGIMNNPIKVINGSLYCLRCSISGERVAIDARRSNVLITGGQSEAMAALSSKALGVSLLEGSQAVFYNASLTGAEGVSMLSNRIRNPRILAARSRFTNSNPDSRLFFKTSFFVEDAEPRSPGLIDIRRSEFRALPAADKDFLLLRQEVTGNGRGGALRIDTQSRYFRWIEGMDKAVPLDKPSLQALVHCENPVGNPMEMRVGLFQLCGN